MYGMFFNLSTLPFFKDNLDNTKACTDQCADKRRGEVIRWEVGWQTKLELMSFTHAWEPTNSGSGVVLSNWFYPIMNCEGPADVWDHQCQQLIKNLASQKKIQRKTGRDRLNARYISPLLVASWCNVSKKHWSSLTFKCDRQNVFFLPLSHRALFTDEAYELVFRVWTNGAGPQEALRHSLTGIIPAKAGELKNSTWEPDERKHPICTAPVITSNNVRSEKTSSTTEELMINEKNLQPIMNNIISHESTIVFPKMLHIMANNLVQIR